MHCYADIELLLSKEKPTRNIFKNTFYLFEIISVRTNYEHANLVLKLQYIQNYGYGGLNFENFLATHSVTRNLSFEKTGTRSQEPERVLYRNVVSNFLEPNTFILMFYNVYDFNIK